MALTCVQHGHVEWADALVQRALALNPRRMLAHRTLGLVRLKQGRWSDAQAVLETALSFDPLDLYTTALLERARAGPPPSPIERAGAGALARRVWRRVLGRLKRNLGGTPT
jgi:tetratricopeptide (TPR) repeat protein